MHLQWPFTINPPQLAVDEAHVWAVSLLADDAVAAEYEATLTPDECTRANGFQGFRLRQRFVAAHGALRMLLGKYLGDRPETITIDVGVSGKPQVKGPRETAQLRFNLSHSGNLALIAVSRCDEVGADLEQLRDVSELERLAKRHFHPSEIAEVLASSVGERNIAFLRCWTAKEAVIKALGTGFTESLNNFSVPSCTAAEGWVDLSNLSSAASDVPCWLTRLSPNNDYIAAVAVIGGIHRVQCFTHGIGSPL